MCSVPSRGRDGQRFRAVHERGDVDPALAAGYPSSAGRAHADGRLDHAELAARMTGDRADPFVDPRLPDATVCDDALGRAEHERTELERVDAEVEQPAATAMGVEQPVRRVDRHPEAEVGFDQQRFADATAVEDVDERPVRWQEPAPDRVHEEQAVRSRRVHHLPRLARVQRKRLLTEHVLAGVERRDRILRVP